MPASSSGPGSLTVMLRCLNCEIRVGAWLAPITAISTPSRSGLVARLISWFSR
jgi:hypothetical protein